MRNAVVYFILLIACLINAAVIGFGYWYAQSASPPSTPAVDAAKMQRLETADLRPLDVPVDLDMGKAELGKLLFSDKRLSKDGQVSCLSCHDFNRGGADGHRFSVGIGGAVGDINAPTVFNSSLNFRQFWNGRADDLAAQADGPVQNPREMGADWNEVVSRLSADQSLRRRFANVFGDGQISHERIVAALVEFERALITLNSPFDRFLQGDAMALTPAQRRGYEKFQQYGCVSCHQGQNIGGNMFQTMGIAHDYFAERGGKFESDEGRKAVTKAEADLHVFKVPSLRNVALTAPYFHDGSEPKLENAIRKMARYQLGRVLPDADIRDLADFLRSLTGETPAILTETKYGTAEN